MSQAFAHLDDELRTIEQAHLYRSRRVLESAQQAVIQLQGREIINFCSNDYLGLANHPIVVKAFQEGAQKYGVGSASAHLICGHSIVHQQLEEELADFTGRQRALLFSTGYMANLAVLTTLLSSDDAVFEDRLNHASLLDGGLFSGARFKRYRHLDTKSLENALQTSLGQKKLIVTDGVFSMDGVIAPLEKLAQTAKEHQAWLMVDDAHGLGVLAEHGAGSVAHFKLSEAEVPILMATMGKALGTFGAFVAGSETLIEYLIQKARTYIYTTALPPATAAASRASLKLLIHDTWRRHKLQDLIQQFRLGAKLLGLQIINSETAIQPVLVGDNKQTMIASDYLLEQGFLVTAIRPPTVAAGQARLRITFTALHQETHVSKLLECLAQVLL